MSKSIEGLIDSDHPLLQKFKEKAPGSHAHCQRVADICEVIARSLGVDHELMKCAAMYHDIGKMVNPEFFSENQNGTSPHDDLDPFISFQLITRHVPDGVMILLQNDFPLDVIKIISEHHGNQVFRYFARKAKSEVDDKYRYTGDPPTSVHASILMVVDSVEATIKSMSESGTLNGNRDSTVEESITKLINDRQLDDMKIGMERTVRDIITREIATAYPSKTSRIDYDNDLEKKGIEEKEEEPKE